MMSPTVKHRFRPYLSVSLPPGIMRAAMIRRNKVMQTCTPWTEVFRSVLMSLIITFMFEPAKLQMNWASASGTSIFRSDPRSSCAVLAMLSTVGYLPAGRITRPEWTRICSPGVLISGKPCEGGRVGDGGGVLVVVEVGVYRRLGRPRAGERLGPRTERPVAVARPGIGGPLVEAQVSPAGGAPHRGHRLAAAVRPAQRGRAGGQHRLDSVAPPRRVPRLDGYPDVRGEPRQAVVEERRVRRQVRRQLEQHGPELAAKAPERVEHPAHRLGRVAEAPHVGEVAAGLDGHHEAIGRPVPPVAEGAGGRQPVERAVVLHRAELPGVVLEPQALRHVPGVERVAPVPVLPARGADENWHGSYRYPRRRRASRVSPPNSSVNAAATQKDRIDADIQLAGVKPMACPADVHAETHQDTYPGLMSW